MSKIHQWVAALILAEGIIMGVFAYVLFLKKSARLAGCRKTRGEVVEVKKRNGGEGGPTLHPVIRYTASNGESVTFESKFGRSS